MRALGPFVLAALSGCGGHFVKVILDDVPTNATQVVTWISVGNQAAEPVSYAVHTTDTVQTLGLELPGNTHWLSATFVARDDSDCDLAMAAGGTANNSDKRLEAEIGMWTALGAECGVDHTAGMVRYPAARYVVGCDDANTCGSNATPTQKVDLDAFELDALEVSVGAYTDCVDAGACGSPTLPSGFPGQTLDSAQNGLSYADAAAFCAWMGKKLPNEAQWEAAMRGTEGRPYPWGTDAPTCDHASYAMGTTVDTTCRFNEFPLLLEQATSLGYTPEGLADGGGNVAEWVEDFAAARSSLTTNDLIAHGPSSGPGRIVKGGDWADPATFLLSSVRSALEEDGSVNGSDLRSILGVRCGK